MCTDSSSTLRVGTNRVFSSACARMRICVCACLCMYVPMCMCTCARVRVCGCAYARRARTFVCRLRVCTLHAGVKKRMCTLTLPAVGVIQNCIRPLCACAQAVGARASVGRMLTVRVCVAYIRQASYSEITLYNAI